MTRVTRFAALGDSVTVGLGDPQADGTWRGWAMLLAESLAPPESLEVNNLARCGAVVADVADEQLPRALEVKPSVASVVVGVNDTLRGDFDIALIAARMEETVVRLRRAGAIVLTASLPDPGRMLRVPEIVRRPLARRVHAINMVLAHLSLSHGTIHLDLANHPDVHDKAMWGADRIHPSERGHRFMAGLFVAALADIGFPIWSRPDPEPTNPEPTLWEQARWLATKGTGWLMRRSLDLLPRLTWLVLLEAWHAIRDQTARLDAQLHAELDHILPRLEPAPRAVESQAG
jgi:lysophospholipase L1-like esterase